MKTRKSGRISLRVSSKTKNKLRKLSKAAKMTQTSFLKQIIFAYPDDPKRDSRAVKLYQEDSEVISAFDRLRRSIDRCGINLNQIARHANENQALDTEKVSGQLSQLELQLSMTQNVLENVSDLFSDSLDQRK